ncbi:hypothetical protein NDU88_002336 [Pleurodeles waltl]|uniref:Uncharacterized protein n=1 Tax=Pleurodeles waltl TaxID=8319 RepID=A0AAV7TKE9_PLEWA|nr:hypothetical protein NDU88_002336 [Pleurodeles waltl]
MQDTSTLGAEFTRAQRLLRVAVAVPERGTLRLLWGCLPAFGSVDSGPQALDVSRSGQRCGLQQLCG